LAFKDFLPLPLPSPKNATKISNITTERSSTEKSSFKGTSDVDILGNIDDLIEKCSQFLHNDEAMEILKLHNEWLYQDRKVEGISDNPFLKDEPADSDYEDSEIDDPHIDKLRQIKRSVDVLWKYNKLHDYNFFDEGISQVNLFKVIRSPLKLSLNQIFAGYENDFIDNDQIKKKFLRSFGRDFKSPSNKSQSSNSKL
jgi:hypothetical protein